jgi:hypothetical protein
MIGGNSSLLMDSVIKVKLSSFFQFFNPIKFNFVSLVLCISEGKLIFSLNSHTFNSTLLEKEKDKISFVVMKSETTIADFDSFNVCNQNKWNNSNIIPITSSLSEYAAFSSHFLPVLQCYSKRTLMEILFRQGIIILSSETVPIKERQSILMLGFIFYLLHFPARAHTVQRRIES